MSKSNKKIWYALVGALMLAVLLAAAPVGAAPPASPGLVTYNFTGAITYVSGAPFGLSASVGQQVQGSFAYDTSQPGYDFGTGAAYIQGPPSGMSVVISGVTIRSQNYNSFQVLNNSYGIDNINGFFTPIIVGATPRSDWSSISFGLSDSTQTAFSSKALPPSLNISSFSSAGGGAYDAANGGSLGFSILTLEPPSIPVTIDIKPGDSANSINPRSNGKTPVAILGSNSFDVTKVDASTARFGKTGAEAAPAQWALEDVNRDGRMDMILHFDTQKAGITCGDTSAILTGKLSDGQAIKGQDTIQTVGCN
ncbi:MAG: hypothetical protein U0822_08290 [Anaerolineae bacterium]